MGRREWQECLKMAAPIVAKIRNGQEELKATLPGACFQASCFAESVGTKKYNKGKRGRWREQRYAYLSGLVVIDVDHIGDPRKLFERLKEEFDLKAEGILLVYISARGEGMKIVFKAREGWANLICQQYEMAQRLGILDYVDDACKDSSRLSFLTGPDDVLYCDKEELFGEESGDRRLESGDCSQERTAYDQLFGERYRQAPKGDSSPTMQKWIDFEQERKRLRRKTKGNVAKIEATETKETPAEVAFSERDEALIKAFNEYYGPSLPPSQKHDRFLTETSHWMCWVCDNDPEKAIAMSHRLDWVKDWKPLQNEVEDLCRSAAQKKVLTRCPKALKELLKKVDGEGENSQTGTEGEDLPTSEWVEKIRGFFGVYPCMQEVCEWTQERLWPFLLFATSGLAGTLMTLCWWFSYDNPFKKRRLNYNVLGIGDPAVGKGPLEDLCELWTEPIAQADQLVNDTMNEWKEQMRSKGSNKDKSPKPKGVVRIHGARTSNNVFINDMMNAWAEVDGERMHTHMLTFDSEALNSIKMAKGGSWIDRSVMEIKSWSNERDSQQYANLDSMTGSFNVFWNQVRTCTPPALKVLANERNFGSGWPLRVSVIPVPDNDFDMIPLHTKSQKSSNMNESTIRMWAYRLDKRQGELPIWPLVEHAWHWTNDHMEMAKFNQDRADRMLLKRIAQTTLCIAAPWVDMRHWEEREKTGSYKVDDTDIALLDLLLDMQYKTQRHYFYELARNYYDEQQKDATTFRRRTTRFEMCYQQLPEEFTTEQFTQVFGYANSRSAAICLNRFLKDKAIKRIKRGVYRKRVQNIN